MSKKVAIQMACAECDYRWPKQLTSGIMFYDGYRITIQEFNKWAKNFR